MTTSVTPDAFLASLTKWGVKWRFYSNKADWLTHNRNAAGNNVRATPGGFGPLRGVAAHNTASTSQTGMLTYLYNGDSARALPGPLCNWAVLKTGEVVLIGWGTSNATGPGDPRPDALVRKNAMPLNSEITPTTSGPSDPDAILYAPYYLGMEACYASEGPTAEQRDAMVRATVAALDAMGGPADGYGAGSVVNHRELTTTRSDPQGWKRDGEFRRAVAAMFQVGPPKASGGTVTPAPLKPVKITLSSSVPAVTIGEKPLLTASVEPKIPGQMVFEYQDDAGKWVRFKTLPVNADTGFRASDSPRPSKNTNYRAGFDPADPAYLNGNWVYITIPVVDLVRLMTEHRAVLDRLAALEQSAPEPAADITPGG